MIPTAFDEENLVLDKPAGMTADQCDALSVYLGPTTRGDTVCISCWKVTAEEMEEIKKTGRVWITIYGGGMPPIAPSGFSPFKS